jgi:hypothetical protein
MLQVGGTDKNTDYHDGYDKSRKIIIHHNHHNNLCSVAANSN